MRAGPSIADFFTKSCVLCRKVEPMLAAVDGAGGTAAFGIDAEENRELAAEYDVRGVPTLLLFHRGELIDRKVGFVTAKELRTWVAPYLETMKAASDDLSELAATPATAVLVFRRHRSGRRPRAGSDFSGRNDAVAGRPRGLAAAMRASLDVPHRRCTAGRVDSRAS